MSRGAVLLTASRTKVQVFPPAARQEAPQRGQSLKAMRKENKQQRKKSSTGARGPQGCLTKQTSSNTSHPASYHATIRTNSTKGKPLRPVLTWVPPRYAVSSKSTQRGNPEQCTRVCPPPSRRQNPHNHPSRKMCNSTAAHSLQIAVQPQVLAAINPTGRQHPPPAGTNTVMGQNTTQSTLHPTDVGKLRMRNH
jgi:hypothetical protein